MHELLRRVAEVDPDRTAVVTHDGAWSYGRLLTASHRAASALTAPASFADGAPRRIGVVDFEAAEVVPLLAAASLVGAEVCLYPPVEPDEVTDLARRLDHQVLVTDRDDLQGAAATVLDVRTLLDADSGPVRAEPEDAARPHLVLTTGTTGVPRGVRHDWSRLLRGVRRVTPASEQRWLLAYGLHQFAGLQVLLHVLAAGATLVAPAPRRPREGLAAMRALGVTHASATPTYWRFLLAEARSDGLGLPPLEQVTMGGEAIPGPLLDDVHAAFPSASVSQVYAASEFGSTGSQRDSRPGLTTDVLDRGDDADVDMRILDGELWIRSRTGMLGYHGEPPVDPDAWRPTGDLVEVVDDRILFRGRSSEVINVGGVKVHPLPIEERVGAVPGVDVARVFARPNPMTGSVVALEVVAAPGHDRDALKASLKAACADLPPAARPRSIRFVDDVATAGGKIVRRQQ
ncbi:MAG: long-chain fatty acid--CoA ligase [Microbacterium sp.]|nr:MAG: long-chain fatty acid--CoA ligase [Microbacterium sp.]